MRIRLTGTPAECAAMVTLLRGTNAVAVNDVSGPYPNRGDTSRARVYLDVWVAQRLAEASAWTGGCQLCGATGTVLRHLDSVDHPDDPRHMCANGAQCAARIEADMAGRCPLCGQDGGWCGLSCPAQIEDGAP